jgi:hypothetical protein
MGRAAPVHSACGIAVSSGFVTALSPFLVPVMRQVVTGEIWLRDLARLFGDLDMMFMWLNMVSNALVIVFGFTAGVGVLLAVFRIRHILFYATAGVVLAVFVHRTFSTAIFGGVLGPEPLPYALTGAACGSLYWLTMRFFSTRGGQDDRRRLL